MCGIGGVMMKQGAVDQTALDAMRLALGKRGPDGFGQFIDHGIGLVHTRLAIIDPEGGKQPITDHKRRTIIFNGEIYNYVEIRRALEHDYPFKTDSDTETILALYDKYGLDFVEHLRGMYAIALYDPSQSRLIIARDPFGIKPFYMVENDHVLAFASEAKALIAAGFASRDVDMKTLRSVLRENYTHGSQTVYPAIDRLPPGITLVYEKGERVSTSYRAATSPLAPQDIDEDVALAQLDSVLDDTVRVHCRSDVGYGVFLSGGVDSSSIMRVLADQAWGDNRIKAYTAYFDVAGSADERAYAQAVAASCMADCQEVPFGADDFRTLLPQIAAYMDDPVADYAILPTWKLASVAARDQKVVLCGEGGDELFAGYGRYRTRWWKDWRRVFAPSCDVPVSSNWTRLQRAQANDIGEYLPNDLLIKLDTCLMAHGLEGRTPFLDPEVSKFAFGLPDSLKLRGRDGKYLLKEWLRQKCPEAEPFRKKQGFTVPVGHWIAEDCKSLGDLLTQNHFVKGLLSRSELVNLPVRLANPQTAKECWGILYLALWYMGKEKKSVAPTIVDALSA